MMFWAGISGCSEEVNPVPAPPCAKVALPQSPGAEVRAPACERMLGTAEISEGALSLLGFKGLANWGGLVDILPPDAHDATIEMAIRLGDFADETEVSGVVFVDGVLATPMPVQLTERDRGVYCGELEIDVDQRNSVRVDVAFAKDQVIGLVDLGFAQRAGVELAASEVRRGVVDVGRGGLIANAFDNRALGPLTAEKVNELSWLVQVTQSFACNDLPINRRLTAIQPSGNGRVRQIIVEDGETTASSSAPRRVAVRVEGLTANLPIAFFQFDGIGESHVVQLGDGTLLSAGVVTPITNWTVGEVVEPE